MSLNRLAPEHRALLQQEIAAALETVKKWRHRLHQLPEIAGHETETSAFIRATLPQLGITPHAPWLETDVIADLPAAATAGNDSRCIGLRADIDGLPVTENNALPYCSTHPGMMHACGHDGHAAMLLGTALVLSRLPQLRRHRVRLIFQPGEEMVCMGRKLAATEACDGVDEIYALHGWPGLPVGAVSTLPGVMFGTGAHFTIRIIGRGAHGAQPENGLNPVPAAGKIAWELQQLHERYTRQNAVISVCRIEGGKAANSIPAEVLIQGTTRYFDAGLNQPIAAAIRELVQTSCEPIGLKWQFDYDDSYRLPVYNHPAQVEKIAALAEDFLPGTWIAADKPPRAREVFAFCLDRCGAGAMFWLGLGEKQPPLHNPAFDFNDQALTNGITMLTLLALAD
ncbi:MAG: M20 family metallopeptidase [Victivallales bacterium]|nr:M20 family metallopeptidase [Victivallales bacterium]